MSCVRSSCLLSPLNKMNTCTWIQVENNTRRAKHKQYTWPSSIPSSPAPPLPFLLFPAFAIHKSRFCSSKCLQVSFVTVFYKCRSWEHIRTPHTRRWDVEDEAISAIRSRLKRCNSIGRPRGTFISLIAKLINRPMLQGRSQLIVKLVLKKAWSWTNDILLLINYSRRSDVMNHYVYMNYRC